MYAKEALEGPMAGNNAQGKAFIKAVSFIATMVATKMPVDNSKLVSPPV